MGTLISTVNYPVTVKYDGESMVVSPRAKLKIEKLSLLQGNLPKGLIIKKNNGGI